MKKKDWTNYWLIAILPFLAVGSVYATEAFARGAFFRCSGGLCDESKSIPDNIWKVLKATPDGKESLSSDVEDGADEKLIQDAQERNSTALRYSGRMTWYLIGEIYLFACIVSISIALVLIYQMFPKRRIFWMGIAIILSYVVGRVLYANPEVHMKIFLVLFEQAIMDDVPEIVTITNFLNSLGNAAVFLLLFAASAILQPSPGKPFPEGMNQISKRMKLLRLFLYSGTVLLVATMLLKKSIYQWSLAYTSQDAEMVKIAANFVSSLLTLDGGFYTLVLAAGYLPAALVLQRRANLLANLPEDEEEKEKQFKVHGLTFSFSESFPRVLAVLGPLLVGPVGEFLTSALARLS
jgi:hypothetical protein